MSLKDYRVNAGLTREQVAVSIGVSYGAIVRWELGTSVPNVIFASKLARVYGISVEQIAKVAEDLKEAS